MYTHVYTHAHKLLLCPSEHFLVTEGPEGPEWPVGDLNSRMAPETAPPSFYLLFHPPELRFASDTLRRAVRGAVTQAQAAQRDWGSPGLRIILGTTVGSGLLGLTALAV